MMIATLILVAAWVLLAVRLLVLVLRDGHGDRPGPRSHPTGDAWEGEVDPWRA